MLKIQRMTKRIFADSRVFLVFSSWKSSLKTNLCKTLSFCSKTTLRFSISLLRIQRLRTNWNLKESTIFNRTTTRSWDGEVTRPNTLRPLFRPIKTLFGPEIPNRIKAPWDSRPSIHSLRIGPFLVVSLITSDRFKATRIRKSIGSQSTILRDKFQSSSFDCQKGYHFDCLLKIIYMSSL